MTITATSDNQIRKSNIRNWTIGLQTFAPGSLPRSGLVQRRLWNIDSGSASVRPDVEGPDDIAPLLGFVGDELAEVGGRARKHGAKKPGTPRLAWGVGVYRFTPRAGGVDAPGGGPFGRPHAVPRADLVARDKLAYGRKVR